MMLPCFDLERLCRGPRVLGCVPLAMGWTVQPILERGDTDEHAKAQAAAFAD